MHLLVPQKLRGAEHRLDDEVGGDLAREPEQDPRLDHRLRQEREVGRAGAGDGGNCVHVALGDSDDAAEMGEHLLGQLEVPVVRVCAGADSGDSLVHDGGRVRHRADDRDAGRDPALDQRRRDGRGDREDGLLGLEDLPDLAEQNGEVLRLDGDHDDRRVRDGLGVRQRRLDAVPVGELLEPLVPPPGGDDLGRLAPARAQ